LTYHIYGGAQRLLIDFIYYASTYPNEMAAAMWYCEDSFIAYSKLLKKAIDEALA